MTRCALLFVALTACTPKAPPTPAAQEAPMPELNADAVAGVTDPALRQLMHDQWEDTMRRSPVWATMLGDHRFDDQFGDWSAQAVASDRAITRGFLERARALDAAGLSAPDALTLALLVLGLEDDVRSEVCEFWQWSLSPRNNALVWVNFLPDAHPVDSPESAQTLLARYGQIAGAFDHAAANLRIGVAGGRVANAATVALVVAQLDGELAKPTEAWALMRPVTEIDLYWEGGSDWAAAMTATVQDEIRPALERYRAVVHDEVLPAARPPESVGVSALPDGQACYEALITVYTTLPLTADELHATGLAELERIHAEFADLGESALGTRDLAEIFTRLRTDPELYFADAEAVQGTAERAVAVAKMTIPEFFGTLPQADVIVRPIPDYEAPYTTLAYYRAPAPDGSKPGEYYINLYEPQTRPRYEAEVLAFHEAIPGHHLQIAIAQELPEIPAYRRHGGFTAFVEGWALYTERLADEMALYSSDLDRLGMLSYDAWRAARLVVDTGLHAKGWTREQAEAFMLENTPQAENNIVNEVDRYINTPGQALAYKIGQLTVVRLRAEAKQALGDDFDLAAFHDVVLGAGAVPLPVLEQQVRAWVEAGGGR